MGKAETDRWYEHLEGIHAAVLTYGEKEVAALARRIIWQLRRMPAVGLYSDGLDHRTVWDEYCYEVQQGPHGHLPRAWDETLAPLVQHEVDRLPRHAAILISFHAQWEIDGADAREDPPAYWTGGICQMIRRALDEAAARDPGRQSRQRRD